MSNFKNKPMQFSRNRNSALAIHTTTDEFLIASTSSKYTRKKVHTYVIVSYLTERLTSTKRIAYDFYIN